MSQFDELFAKLSGVTFRRELEQWAQKVIVTAKAFEAGFEGSEVLKGDWSGSLQEAMSIEGRIEQIFSKVTGLLRPPQIVGSEEVVEAFDVYLQRNDDRIFGDFETLYECFLDHIRHRLLIDQFQAFDACKLVDLLTGDEAHAAWFMQMGYAVGKAEVIGAAPEMPPPPEVTAADESTGSSRKLVIAIRDDIAVSFARIRLEGELNRLNAPSKATKGILEVRLHGRMSTAAIHGLASEVMPVLVSVIRSVRLLRPPDGTQVISHAEKLPVIRVDELCENAAFLSSSVNTLFARSGRKDTIPRRIGNAVRLLAEADGQSSDAIRLALSVTAIEALLGRDGAGDISKALAENVAVLLEPIAADRQRAYEFVKALYGKRSRTLHGDDVAGDQPAAVQARTLAAGCLFGVWFRNDFLQRLGDQPETPDAMLKTLAEKRWDGTRPDGAPDLPAVQKLWRVTAT